MTGVSPMLEDRYIMYPSVEVDIIAVNAAEANEIKSAGVDAYFSPDNPLRNRLDPFTIFFSDEHTEPIALPYDAPPWFVWKTKKPATLAIIVSLPDDPDAPPDGPDPRMLFVPLKKHFSIQDWYFQVEPKSVVQIYQKPLDPRLATHDSLDADTSRGGAGQSTIVKDSAKTQAEQAAEQAQKDRDRAKAKAEAEAAKAEAEAENARKKAEDARAKADAIGK
jgi:hypothetical protein